MVHVEDIKKALMSKTFWAAVLSTLLTGLTVLVVYAKRNHALVWFSLAGIRRTSKQEDNILSMKPIEVQTKSMTITTEFPAKVEVEPMEEDVEEEEEEVAEIHFEENYAEVNFSLVNALRAEFGRYMSDGAGQLWRIIERKNTHIDVIVPNHDEEEDPKPAGDFSRTESDPIS